MTIRTTNQSATEGPVADWVALPATPAAAGLARRFLARGLGLDSPDVVDVAVLLTSELVANAVRHGREPITLQLARHECTVRIEVHDGGPSFAAPPAGAPGQTDEGGRGMLLLDALATSWGVCSGGSATSGKTLWFEIHTAKHGAAAHG